MLIRFSKMNGLGNDYVFLDIMNQNIGGDYEKLAIRLSNRHFGIGADGIVLIDRSEVADFSMRIFNADGSEAEMCGNAVRCLAKYVYDRGLTDKKIIKINTLSGIKIAEVCIDSNNGKVEKVRVNMGMPSVVSKDCEDKQILLNTSKGVYKATCISIGNPHAVIFVNELGEIDMDLGREISENIMIFPQRINVEFLYIIDRENAIMRVYERGTGETLACGTGACASFYAGYIHNKLDSSTTIHLKGGELQIEIINDIIFMQGKAELNYEGEIFL